MAEDIANLVIAVESTGVAKASARLDDLGRSSKAADTNARQMAKGVGIADKNVEYFSRATTAAAADTKNLTKAIAHAETEAYKMAKVMERTGGATSRASTTFKSVGKASNDATGGFRIMKGATQNLSYQLQDVAVQAQMGTSAFTILGQQGPQIASIFGPGGAVVGVLVALGAMIGGTLVAAMGDAGEGSKALEDTLARLDDQLVRTKNGTIELSERITELGKVSAAAAAAQIVSSMHDARQAIRGSIVAVDDMVDGVGSIDFSSVAKELKALRGQGFADSSFTAETESYATAVGGVSAALDAVALRFNISKAQALGFVDAAGALKEGDLRTYNNLRVVVDDLVVSQKALSPGLAEFRRGLVENDSVILENIDNLNFLKKVRRQALGGESLAPVTEGASDKASKARLQAIADEEDALDEWHKLQADYDSQYLAREASKAEAAKRSLATRTGQAQTYLANLKMLGLDEEQTFAARQERLTAKLKEHFDARALTEAEYNEGIDALRREARVREATERDQYMIAWQEQTLEAMTNMDMLGASMAGNFTNNMAGAFDSILMGTASAEDAFKDMAGGMAKAVVSSLTEMAAQWVAYTLVQKLLGKTAQAGEASAMSLNASAAVAMAGLNAFASTAAIPIVGPVLAGPAAAAAIAATSPMAASVAALSTAAVGARALGGQVRGGESYLVGERGPELLHMGTSGRVVPNDKIGGGGGVSIVNNIDASGNGAEVDIKIQQAMMQTNRQTVAQVQDLLRRGRLT